MANEQKTGAPLTAPLGEQLREKARLDEARSAEREADEVPARRVERRKTVEREAALRHAEVGEARGRRRGRGGAAHAGEGHARWPLLVGAFALFGVLLALGRIARR